MQPIWTLFAFDFLTKLVLFLSQFNHLPRGIPTAGYTSPSFSNCIRSPLLVTQEHSQVSRLGVLKRSSWRINTDFPTSVTSVPLMGGRAALQIHFLIWQVACFGNWERWPKEQVYPGTLKKISPYERGWIQSAEVSSWFRI